MRVVAATIWPRVTLAFGGKRGFAFFEHVGVAADVADGGAQVVGDGVGKGFQLLVGAFELGGALADLAFEGGVLGAQAADGQGALEDGEDGA